MYKVSDTKYRYVKLEAPAGIKKWLGEVDKLYFVDRNMRNIVIAKEEENQRNFEMWEKSAELEKETKELKGKVNGSDKKK